MLSQTHGIRPEEFWLINFSSFLPAPAVTLQVVNERLSELFGLWDMDGTGCIELEGRRNVAK